MSCSKNVFVAAAIASASVGIEAARLSVQPQAQSAAQVQLPTKSDADCEGLEFKCGLDTSASVYKRLQCSGTKQAGGVQLLPCEAGKGKNFSEYADYPFVQGEDKPLQVLFHDVTYAVKDEKCYSGLMSLTSLPLGTAITGNVKKHALNGNQGVYTLDDFCENEQGVNPTGDGCDSTAWVCDKRKEWPHNDECLSWKLSAQVKNNFNRCQRNNNGKCEARPVCTDENIKTHDHDWQKYFEPATFFP